MGKQAVAAATGGSSGGGEGTKAPLAASACHPTSSTTSQIAHLGPALLPAAPRARCRCSAWLSAPAAAAALLPVQPISCRFTGDQLRGMAKRGRLPPARPSEQSAALPPIVWKTRSVVSAWFDGCMIDGHVGCKACPPTLPLPLPALRQVKPQDASCTAHLRGRLVLWAQRFDAMGSAASSHRVPGPDEAALAHRQPTPVCHRLCISSSMVLSRSAERQCRLEWQEQNMEHEEQKRKRQAHPITTAADCASGGPVGLAMPPCNLVGLELASGAAKSSVGCVADRIGRS